MEEEGGDFRNWSDMIPDTLGLIFKNLILKEILTVIPSVCKSWAKAVNGPYCWQEIDIEQWSKYCQPQLVDRMLRMLINRSCGSVCKLCVSSVDNDQAFSYIADHAGSLQTLVLTRSTISDSIVEKVAGKLPTIRILDLSSCCQIRARAFEAIGNNCRFLEALKWNMHPSEVKDEPSHDDVARAIATTMPKLKQLELAYHNFDTHSVLEILSGCPELELLDLRGCWSVKLDKKFMETKYPNVTVLGPQIRLGYVESSYLLGDSCSDDDWMDYSSDDDLFDDDILNGYWNDEELELRIYEGFDDMQAIGWPPSP